MLQVKYLIGMAFKDGCGNKLEKEFFLYPDSSELQCGIENYLNKNRPLLAEFSVAKIVINHDKNCSKSFDQLKVVLLRANSFFTHRSPSRQ